MKNNKYYYVWWCMFFIPVMTYTQNTQPIINSTLHGWVIDEKTKEPIIGAVVQIKGTTHGVQTDPNGQFYFQTGQILPYTLVVTYIGFKTKEIIAETNSITIDLAEDVKQLNELVVIGYGTVAKKDLTGSVASVSNDAIRSTQTTVEKALQGSIAGVQVTQTSGQPGGGLSIRIRGGSSIQGGNEPLYVIDGFPVYNSSSTAGILSGSPINPLSSINPSDIESITVLKDASSTAIYGSRGANGVVIITTKKGKINENTLNYDFSIGTQRLGKFVDVLDAAGFAKLRNDALYDTNPNKGRNQYVSEEAIHQLGHGVDWQDEAFQTAPLQNHQLSLTGGSRQTRYLISGNYFAQDGIIKNTGFDRKSIRANLNSELNNKFRFGLNLTGSSTQSKVAPTGLISALLSMPPTATIYEKDGSYTLRNPFENIFSNPIAALNERKNNAINHRILGTAFGEYDILNNLSLKVLVGSDIFYNKEDSYLPASIYEGLATGGEAKIGVFNSISVLNENTLTYSKVFSTKHYFNIVAGFTQQQTKNQFVTTGAQQFISDITTSNSIQSGNVSLLPTSGESAWALNSYLSRINYNFDTKYFLTASIRTDGSSRFGKSNKWGYFPSGAFAWQVDKEPFFKPIQSIFNTFKLRTSFGSTGNQEIGEYQSLSTLTSVKYLFGDQIATGFTPTRIANTNLSWEQTKQIDAGLDIGILQNKIFITADVYRKVTSDLLLNVQIPYTTGQTASLQNFGSVRNQGIELGINSNIGKNDFYWNSNFNIAFNQNKILAIGNGADFYTFDNYIVKVGDPLGSFYGAVTNGVLQTNELETKGVFTGNAIPKAGDRIYKDINVDGKFTTAADRTTIGNALPKFTFGFTNTFNYNAIEFSFQLQGTSGNKILNSNAQSLELFNGQQNAASSALQRWTIENPSATIPRAKLDPAPVFSDRYVEDGSYLRVRNLSLSYTLPKALADKASVKAVKFRLVGQNLFTLTKYSGFDPEVTNGTTISPGTDAGIYPIAKSISAGINITL